MDAPWNSTLLIATAAFLSGIFIARLTTVALQQRLQSRRLLAAGVVFTFVLLIALTYHDPPLGIGIALVATASGFLLWRRPYPKVTAELQTVPQHQAHLSDELGQSEGFYRALFEAASDAIVITQNLKIVFGNRAAAKLFGLAEPAQLVGRHAMDFIAPESQPLARERTARMMAGETAAPVEARFRKADGSPIEVEISSAPFLLHGRPAVLSIVREVTARKRMEAALRQSEARFRSLTELSSDWYWEQDAQFRTTFVSERYTAANGLRMDANLGKTRFEIGKIWESEEQKHQHRTTLEAHRPFNDLRVSRYDEDGRLHHLSISGRPAFDADGRFIGYHGIGRDVTEQERMQRALRDSEARFRSLTELSSDWYWEQDAEFRFTDRCSDGLAKSGFDRRKLIGRRRGGIL